MPISVVVVMTGLEAEAGDGVAHEGGVFPGVDLEHHRGAVSGLAHDGVRVVSGMLTLSEEFKRDERLLALVTLLWVPDLAV